MTQCGREAAGRALNILIQIRWMFAAKGVWACTYVTLWVSPG